MTAGERSATEPSAEADEPLRVTFVIPVLNEERHVAAAIESVLAQQGLDAMEVLVLTGRSTDRTDHIVNELAARHPQIRNIPNPRNAIAIAMNTGIAQAQYPVIIRVDAHSVLPVGYAVTAVRALRSTGATNVGGRMRAEGTTVFERAVAWGYNSPAGLGGAIYHTGGEAGPAESAYLGVFLRDPVLAIGGFDEALARGEDWEFNRRIAHSGGLVWFEPSLEVVYRPRSTLRRLARQFHASGRWRGQLIRRLGVGMPARYFVPPLLLVALIAGLATMIGGVVLQSLAVTGIGLVPFGIYGAWLAAVAFSARVPWAVRAQLLIVLPTMHLSWGAGCIAGIVRKPDGLNAYSGR